MPVATVPTIVDTAGVFVCPLQPSQSYWQWKVQYVVYCLYSLQSCQEYKQTLNVFRQMRPENVSICGRAIGETQKTWHY